MSRIAFAALAAAISLAVHTGTGIAHDAKHHKIPEPAPVQGFEPPPAGTYALPVIKPAGPGEVLGEDGRPRRLAAHLAGRITIMSFIYTRCGDVCPLATMHMAELRRMAAADPAVASSLQLVTLSFDPEHDTPDVMADHGEMWRDEAVEQPEWEFFTTAGTATLRPILEAYDQPLGRPDGNGEIKHLMRVFLIDREGRIRNIYSPDFLDPGLLMADIRTLLMEEQRGY